ncbi:MAG: NADH-quinone oxidoreductase subunit A [Planctomycetota bacterium]
MATPTSTAAYLILFAGMAGVFILINLTLGRLLRPSNPTPEKGEVYECGEPVIGSSFVQFDIRFYVVALLFIIFDVEVSFFFPWAVVLGKATQIAAAGEAAAQATGEAATEWAGVIAAKLAELGVPAATGEDGMTARAVAETTAAAEKLARGALIEFAVFFGVLMVGFAYAWSRGDLDWVRTSVNRPIPDTQSVVSPADRAA